VDASPEPPRRALRKLRRQFSQVDEARVLVVQVLIVMVKLLSMIKDQDDLLGRPGARHERKAEVWKTSASSSHCLKMSTPSPKLSG
jgi:hypothetical protein